MVQNQNPLVFCKVNLLNNTNALEQTKYENWVSIIAAVPQDSMLRSILFNIFMIFSSIEKDLIYVIMKMTVLFTKLTIRFQYYYLNRNGKTNRNELESLQTHCATYKTIFCCNFLKNEFYMVILCQAKLYLIVFYQNKVPWSKGWTQ